MRILTEELIVYIICFVELDVPIVKLCSIVLMLFHRGSFVCITGFRKSGVGGISGQGWDVFSLTRMLEDGEATQCVSELCTRLLYNSRPHVSLSPPSTEA